MSVPNSLKLSALLLACHLPLNSFAANDEFEAYRRQQTQGAQQVHAEFRAYKEQQDREFAGFLKSQWREFDTFRGRVRIAEPKPRHTPVVVAPAAPNTPPAKPIVVIPPAPPAAVKPQQLGANQVTLGFYGNAVQLVFDPQWKKYQLNSAGAKPEIISDFWGQMSSSQYEPTLDAMNAARAELKLDDWGYVTLWRELARALQPHPAEQNLLLWFFLVKSGYDVRLGYAGSDVHLWVAVKQAVYATKFTTVGTQTYYAALDADHGDSIGRFYTYDAHYPRPLKALDIHAASTAFTKAAVAIRSLSFDYKGKNIQFSVPYDRRLVEYMASFPQSEFELYFDTQGSALLRQGLLLELRKYTDGMRESDAVNFLLTFVQKAFPYKTDEEQFGREKYFFVEESLHYPFNDCEDRAVLFAWLVHELIGIKAVGLLYPGHMSAAVALKQTAPDAATVEYQGQRFTIADPTYIGASAGMAMPSYQHLKPTRIVDIQL